jgi:drug/metabolite transporter (DMT)-like permease
VAVVCALLSAFAYGIGDFIGGVGGRRSDLAWLIVADQVVALLGAVAGALILGGTLTPQVWVWGAVSGVGSGIGTVCLLRGLAAGRMTIVAPLSAVITAALPAVVGLFSGDRLTWPGWLGIALALPAVALASWSGAGSGFRMTDVGAGLIAGAGFGLMFVALDRAGGTEAGAWPLLPGQLVALLVVLAAAAPSVVGRRRPRRPVMIGAAVRWGGAAGLLGACANLLFLLSAGTGQLTVAAVLTALYPVVTVVLAVLVLKERLGYGQRAGLLTAAAAVVLIVTGS